MMFPVRAPLSRQPPLVARSARQRVVSVQAKVVTSSFPTNPFATGSTHLTVFNVNEVQVPLAELTKGKAILALVRHFGCPVCWEQIHALQLLIPKFEAHGYKLVVVGVGSGSSALKVCEKTGFPTDRIFGDPSKEAYRILSMESGLTQTFFSIDTPKAMLNRGFEGLKEATANYVPIPPRRPDDVLQQGGLFIFEDGVTKYGWTDASTGDHAPMSDVLDICCGSA